MKCQLCQDFLNKPSPGKGWELGIEVLHRTGVLVVIYKVPSFSSPENPVKICQQDPYHKAPKLDMQLII